ncbi:hypothetical protein [Actinomyces denticolens]|uniref:hypothetical protein n=1 Tax=Actinomyces denticolens TaxID=52767 RepID=UPI0011614C3A
MRSARLRSARLRSARLRSARLRSARLRSARERDHLPKPEDLVPLHRWRSRSRRVVPQQLSSSMTKYSANHAGDVSELTR